jgi:cystathionine beta-lyase
MSYDFDHLPDRRRSDSNKWNIYAPDVLPMWVADMDFKPPPAVLRALNERIDHGIFGYGHRDPELAEVIRERLARLYDWEVEPQDLMYLPGLGCALNLVCKAIGQPGDQVLIQTPIYPPFLDAPDNQDRRLATFELACHHQNGLLHYEIDFDAFERAIGDRPALFMLCNPHNPVGKMFERADLERLAETCCRNEVVICTDEIHCDLILDDHRHHPVAAVGPEISKRCITLMAPSKTFNLAGFYFGFAVVQDRELRRRLERAARGIVPHANIMGPHAALAAYRDGGRWVQDLLQYLVANRDFCLAFVRKHMPEIAVTAPNATFLLWMDCRSLDLDRDPYTFFLEHARVALNDGRAFGPGGEGFVRLNFGCPRVLLEEGLERMRVALKNR